MSDKIWNAEITSTQLGVEGHGIMTFYITLKGDGCGISIGGISLRGTGNTGDLLERILSLVGCEAWEDLKGKYLRVETEGLGGTWLRIGNLLKDDWLTKDDMVAIAKGES